MSRDAKDILHNIDFGSILYCIIEDILNETDKNIDEIYHILKENF